MFLGDLDFEQAGAQHLHGLLLVFLLRTTVHAADDHAGGLVLDLHSGVGGVHALATRAGGTADVDLKFVRVELDINLLGLGQHGDGDGARVDAPLRFRRGHALHAVDAALEFQFLENVLPLDAEDDLLVAAEVGGTGVHLLDAPAQALGVADVHSVQVGTKQRGLGPAGAGPDFHDRVA